MVCQNERNTDPILEAGKHVVSNPPTNKGTRADAVKHTKPWWAAGINAVSVDGEVEENERKWAKARAWAVAQSQEGAAW